jgi:hypothetical protein
MHSKTINPTSDREAFKQTKPTKSSFPKIKMDGFFEAVKNTNMIEVIELIKKEKITKL